MKDHTFYPLALALGCLAVMAGCPERCAAGTPTPAQVRADIVEVCHQERIHPALLLAIASRESDFGLTLDRRWKGDHGHGHGVFQVDSRYHGDWLNANNWRDTKVSCRYAIRLLRSNLRELGNNINKAVAAYNCGPTNVRRALAAGKGVDGKTTGRDYSRDVFRRMRRLALAGN